MLVKSIIALSFAALAVAAPTPQLEERQTISTSPRANGGPMDTQNKGRFCLDCR
jgi:hypothetical protein